MTKVQCATESAKSAIDTRGRELRPLCCEPLRVLIIQFVQSQTGEIAGRPHFLAVSVVFNRTAFPRVFCFHVWNEITIKKLDQSRNVLLLTNPLLHPWPEKFGVQIPFVARILIGLTG